MCFIDFLLQPITEHFLDLSQLEIPNLTRVAKQYHDKPGPVLPALYTEKTCEEIHHLLCHLLRRFEAALMKLHEFQNRSLEDRRTDDFEMAVYAVAICGVTLRSLVHSSFLEEHIIRIQAPNPYPQECVGNAGINVPDLNMHMSREALMAHAEMIRGHMPCAPLMCIVCVHKLPISKPPTTS
jgi:hypothetical protein